MRTRPSEAIHKEEEIRRSGVFLSQSKRSIEIIRGSESIDDSAFELEADRARGDYIEYNKCEN